MQGEQGLSGPALRVSKTDYVLSGSIWGLGPSTAEGLSPALSLYFFSCKAGPGVHQDVVMKRGETTELR